MEPVTLEITLSPKDLRHAVHVLPHQLRQWAGQVDDVQLTLNTLAGTSQRGDPSRRQLVELLSDLCQEHAHARVVEVDDSPAVRAAVSARFFRGRPVPAQNHDGGPLYSYFFGWHAARYDHVFHVDSDMLFGGGSQTWMAEALRLLRSRPDVLTSAPLPGPPTSDGRLPERVLAGHALVGVQPRTGAGDPWTYELRGCSTRVWLFDRATLSDRLGGVPLERPRLRSCLRALLEHRPLVELPEKTMSRRMDELGLRRVDFLGAGPGMWSLHPPMRSEEFYAGLPALVDRVERGDIPREQEGDFDVNDSLVDWSSARDAARGTRGFRRAAGVLKGRATGSVDRPRERRPVP